MKSEALIKDVKGWVRALTEIGVALIALSIVAAILLGDGVPFLGGANEVVGRIIEVINELGSEGVVGLVALGVIVYIFNKNSG